MKKLILMFSLLALIACNKESNPPAKDNDSGVYTGTLTVTANADAASEPYIAQNISYELNKGNDGGITLTMRNIRFAASMPMPMTIDIPSLQYAHKNGVIQITSTVSPIVPYIGGRPYEVFEILDFTGQLSGKELTINFTCKNSKIPVGDTTLDHKASYKGTLTE